VSRSVNESSRTRPPSVCIMTFDEGPEDVRRAARITVSVGEEGVSLTICRTRRSVEETGLPERFKGSRTASSFVFDVQVESGTSGPMLLECETIDSERGPISILETGPGPLCPGWV